MGTQVRRSVALWILTLFVAAFASERAFAQTVPQGTPVAHRRLANGLEVFVAPNDSVPLATICVVFRGGAAAQTPETAGLFHLYEHMLFAGNQKYPTQAAFTAALNRLGVPNWNGATGTEYINYYITLPSDKLAQGIEFWSWAVKKPIFDPEKLASEKGVVINEIRGYQTDPNHIVDNALESRMFPAYPWRKNIDGPESNIAGATPAQLEAMRAAYYTPKNTALMIGGDVDPEEAFALAETWFGDYTGGERPSIAEPPQGPLPGLGGSREVKLVYPDDSFYDGIAHAQFRWRGPDVLRQTKDTYTSDVLLFLLSSPVGRFKQTLMEKGSGLYDPEYIGFGYPTARDGGNFYFSTYLLLQDPQRVGATLERVEGLRALVLEEFARISKDPEGYFGAQELAKAKAKLIDQNLLSMEVASSFVTGTLSFWWSVATTDYFFGYEEACGRVSFKDISGLIDRYLIGAPSATALRLNTQAYTAEPALARGMPVFGYGLVEAETAFWWQQK